MIWEDLLDGLYSCMPFVGVIVGTFFVVVMCFFSDGDL